MLTQSLKGYMISTRKQCVMCVYIHIVFIIINYTVYGTP